ncbi:MAG: L,D-transpeptidase family protein [Acidobacteria bacterium]|nr:L,D-transpeptidase family protein [Acidobacteriota bacterium]
MKRRRLWKCFFIVFCAALAPAALVLYFQVRQIPAAASKDAVDPAIAAMDEAALRKQISLTEEKLRRLDRRMVQLFPADPVVLVDSAANQICLIRNSKIEIQDKCSTGTGFELTDEGGNRTWTFDTPRGYFRVTGKVANPVWIRPDWSFIEEGEPIPKKREDRVQANVLGDYAIAFGNGYFIHGTLYTRLLGTSVTHGCIRVGDETLKKIYKAVRTGTAIWIY